MLSSKKTYKMLDFVGFNVLVNWSVQYLGDSAIKFNRKYPFMRIGDFLTRNKTGIEIQDNETYKRATIRVRNGGIYLRDTQDGRHIGTKKQFLIKAGQFLLSKIDARNGAFGVVPDELDGGIITGNFWTFDVDYTIINPHFLTLLTTTKQFTDFCEQASNGTTNRHYLQEPLFLNIKVPVPSLEEQNKLVEEYDQAILNSTSIFSRIYRRQRDIAIKLLEDLGVSVSRKRSSSDECYTQLAFMSFSKMQNWSAEVYVHEDCYKSAVYPVASLNNNPSLYVDIFRGKSPKYENNTNTFILNQKCVRWGKIDKIYAKSVDAKWLEQVDPCFFTREGDVLINSTGEGTIGRASVVDKDNVGLLYDSHILLVRLNSELINPEYFVAVFNSEYGQEQVNNVKSAQSTKQTELGIGNLKRIFFPIPPIEVQDKIVKDRQEIHRQNEQDEQLQLQMKKQAIVNFETQIFE